jgi:hypothetical protein
MTRAGSPWYTLQAELVETSAGVAFGPIFKTNGPYFGGQFDPSQVGIAVAGSGQLLFSGGRYGGTFQYVVDGVVGVKSITRQIID